MANFIQRTGRTSLSYLRVLAIYCLVAVGVLFSLYLSAHQLHEHSSNGQDNPRAISNIHWPKDDVASVVTAGYPVTFGLYAFTGRRPHQMVQRKDNQEKVHSCIKANFLAFDVDDGLTYDIDETVTVNLLIDTSDSGQLYLGYDKRGQANTARPLESTANEGLKWVEAALPRARFANRGIQGTDIAISTLETMLPEKQLATAAKTWFTLCDIKIDAKPKALEAIEKVAVSVNFLDENQQNTPVRFGLYDENGDIVLLDNEVIKTSYFEEKTAYMSLSDFISPAQQWPHKNRYFYYSSGSLAVNLKPGSYQLIATKGPEYRIVNKTVTITQSGKLDIKLIPWQKSESKGWFSGDTHIHMTRQRTDNASFMSVLAAENLHVSNMLVMSNIRNRYYQQYAFGEQGRFQIDNRAIVSGIEGPRTAHRGHTLSLNIEALLAHDDSRYFLYRDTLAAYQKQGAITGYAHVGSGEFNEAWGLALDAPTGVVDFVEIMQANQLRTSLWYQLLNVGFQIAPAAGSDFPYFDQPGAVRSYVKLGDEKLTTELWFERLASGQTYVSNAPQLSFSIAQQGIGSVLNLADTEKVSLSFTAAINPDYDSLKTVNVIHCGDVVKSYSTLNREAFSAEFEIAGLKQGWYALEVIGNGFAKAHSGAIYVSDNKGNTYCPAKIEDTANVFLTHLDNLSKAQLDTSKPLEYWDSNEITTLYGAQRERLQQQVNNAIVHYKNLIKNASKSHH